MAFAYHIEIQAFITPFPPADSARSRQTDYARSSLPQHRVSAVDTPDALSL